MEWSQRLGGVGERFSGFLLSSALLELGDLNAAGEVLRGALAADEANAPGGSGSTPPCWRSAGGQTTRRVTIWPGPVSCGRCWNKSRCPRARSRLAELSTAWGDPAEAFAVLERSLPFRETDPTGVDSLLVAAARATADLVERARDDRDEESVRRHLLALDSLVSARGELLGTPFALYGDNDTLQPARAALFAAERSRAEGGADQVERWREAIAACATAGLGWEQHCASWRLATVLVAGGQAARRWASCSAPCTAMRSSKAPFRCSGRSRTSPDWPGSACASQRMPASAPTPVAFAGLTPREAEVLSHLVADRTYAEIASALFISEKTVSVHVSNLLRKSGCGSRREVAALARRVGWDGTAAAAVS